MSAAKLSRKEIRSPDAFQRVTTDYWKKLLQHRKTILGAAGAVVVCLIVAGALSAAAARKAESAGDALSRALDAARQGVEGSFDPNADPNLPRFPSFQAKFEEIARRMEEVQNQHPDTEAAQSAAYYLADARFHLAQYEEAVRGYEALLASTRSGNPLRALSLEGLGYAYEAQQQWDKALSAFERMGKEASGDALKAQAAYHRARVLAESGKKDEALAAFRKVQDDFKDTAAARAAADRVALLSSQAQTTASAGEAEPAEAK